MTYYRGYSAYVHFTVEERLTFVWLCFCRWGYAARSIRADAASLLGMIDQW